MKIIMALAISTLVVTLVSPSWAELEGDYTAGKVVFMKEDAKKNSCNTCHPKGTTNNKVLKGKKVPNLSEAVPKLGDAKLIDEIEKHLKKEMAYKLTDKEKKDLIFFVKNMPKNGFGDK